MVEKYSGVYTDRFGSEKIEIANDGETLRTTIRGFEFSSHAFDQLAPVELDRARESGLFKLDDGWFHELLACTLIVEMPFKIIMQGAEKECVLDISLSAHDPDAGEHYNSQRLRLSLREGENVLASTYGFDDFEFALVELKALLAPLGATMKNCFGCQFSDYHVVGSCFFGHMMCFKNVRNEYQRVQNKREYLDVIDRFEREVQETWLCEDFEPRKPGTGYRG